MSIQSEREALIEELVRKFRQQLVEQLPDKDQTLDQIEDIAGHVGNAVSQVSANSVRRPVQEQITKKEENKSRVKRQSCSCGKELRYKGRKSHQIVTRHGILCLRRAIYHCSVCQKNTVSSDIALGLDAGGYTTRIREWVAHLGALLPFGQAANTLERLTQVSLSVATLERIAVFVGNALRKQQQGQFQAHHMGHLPEPTGKIRRRLYLGMDGVFVPLCDEWKKDGSQGNVLCRYAECKLGVVCEPQIGKDDKDCQVVARTYTATMNNAEAFGPMVGTLAHQEGHHLCRDVVILADGAAWKEQSPTGDCLDLANRGKAVSRGNANRGLLSCLSTSNPCCRSALRGSE